MKTLLFYLIFSFMFSNTRDVYIFYSSSGIVQKDEQLTELNKNKKALQERDIVVHVIQTNSENKEAKKWNITISAPFTFILAGKDGGEKLRSTTFISNEKLFATIDAMPMRRQEMKKHL